MSSSFFTISYPGILLMYSVCAMIIIISDTEIVLLLTYLLTYLLKGLVLLNVFLLIDSRVYSAIISLHTFTFTFETAPSFIGCITDADGNTPAWSMTFSRVCQLVCVYVCLFAFTDQTATDIFTKLGSYYLATPTSFILKVKDQDQGLGLGLELS